MSNEPRTVLVSMIISGKQKEGQVVGPSNPIVSHQGSICQGAKSPNFFFTIPEQVDFLDIDLLRDGFTRLVLHRIKRGDKVMSDMTNVEPGLRVLFSWPPTEREPVEKLIWTENEVFDRKSGEIDRVSR